METKVRFDTSKYFALMYVAAQIVKYEKGEISSMYLSDIQTAISELQRVERTCEEIEPAAA